MSYQMGCQEEYIRTHSIFGETMSRTLDSVGVCPAKNKVDAEKHLKYSRHLGCGTFILLIVMIIIFIKIAQKNNL